MDKIVKGIGYLTIAYVGIYFIDCVAVETGADEKLVAIFDAILRTNSYIKKQSNVNKTEMGFH